MFWLLLFWARTLNLGNLFKSLDLIVDFIWGMRRSPALDPRNTTNLSFPESFEDDPRNVIFEAPPAHIQRSGSWPVSAWAMQGLFFMVYMGYNGSTGDLLGT